jgi:hypothetical protein
MRVQLIEMIAQARPSSTGWQALFFASHNSPDVLDPDTVARHHLPNDRLA